MDGMENPDCVRSAGPKEDQELTPSCPAGNLGMPGGILDPAEDLVWEDPVRSATDNNQITRLH